MSDIRQKPCGTWLGRYITAWDEAHSLSVPQSRTEILSVDLKRNSSSYFKQIDF